MKRSPIRRVSKKRSAELREYAKLRKQFLIDHPYCQWWLVENGYDKDDVYGTDGVGVHIMQAPKATEIHHVNKRHGKRLNDMRYWLAVSREAHEWIEQHKDLARQRGYLMNI